MQHARPWQSVAVFISISFYPGINPVFSSKYLLAILVVYAPHNQYHVFTYQQLALIGGLAK